MIAVDASVLIAHLDPSDAHHAAAGDVLLADDAFLTSVVTLAEVLVGPARGGAGADARDVLGRLGVVAAPLRDADAGELAALRARTGRKLPDCCVLHVARSRRLPLATFDRRLAASTRELGIVVIGEAGPGR